MISLSSKFWIFFFAKNAEKNYLCHFKQALDFAILQKSKEIIQRFI